LFAKLVDDLTVSYDYAFRGGPSAVAQESFTLHLIASAPGVWQKDLELVAPTAFSGPFRTTAHLSMQQIQGLISTIEREIGQTSDEHQLRVVAEVRTHATRGTDVIDETYRQELPGVLSKGILTWGQPGEQALPGTLAGWDYAHAGKFGVAARLLPNVLFGNSSATGVGQVLPKGWPLYTESLERLHMTYAYALTADRAPTTLDQQLQIVLKLARSKGWSKEFVIEPRTALLAEANATSFDLDLASISDLVKRLDVEAGGASDALDVSVTATVDTTGDVAGSPLVQSFSHTATGSLKGGIFTWANDLTHETPGQIESSSMLPTRVADVSLLAPLSMVGLGQASLLSMRQYAVAAVLVALAFATYMLMLVRIGAASRATTELRDDREIRRKYADLIATVGEIPSPVVFEKVVVVASLKDIVKIAIVSSRPVLEFAQGGMRQYSVLDEGTRYVYAVTEVRETPPEEPVQLSQRPIVARTAA
jgi:hypothetical protein